ncbi:unnamed protein product [marine sediment metagenome]|uniref:NIF system FeS cluster assembly NifU N-terminal domain-containing protein n=1 Tax=marine sediment metagenome TaxID=412755 RepID=X1K8D8_9ZZZZ
MSEERKVVSTQVVHCNQWHDEGVDALLVVYDDGTVEVHCEGGCGAECRYGTQVS